MLSIRSNTCAIAAQVNLSQPSAALKASMQRLSTGLRINAGAEGPVSLVIGTKQSNQIESLHQSLASTNNAVALVQTGEGALNEINSLLNKARNLALDSAHVGTNDANAIAANQSDIMNAMDTINSIAHTTQFGSKKLLDGTVGITADASNHDVDILATGKNTQAGEYKLTVTQAAERASITALPQSDRLSADEKLTINGINLELKKDMTQDQVISAINNVSDMTDVTAAKDAQGNTQLMSRDYGESATLNVISTRDGDGSAGFSTLERTAQGLDAAGSLTMIGEGSNITAKAEGKGQSLNFSFGSDNFISLVAGGQDSEALEKSASGDMGTITVTDNSLQFQIGAASSQSVSFAFDQVSTAALGKSYNGHGISSLADIDVSTSAGAENSVKVIDQALSEVSALRSRLGAFQSNTLEANAKNMQASITNLPASESLLRDTDFASEVADTTRASVLLQAGTTALTIADSSSQLILSLLH